MITRHYLLSAALLLAAGCTHVPSSQKYFPDSWRQSSNNFVFEAEPSVIRPGETALLRWNVQGATSVTIEEAPGDDRLHVIGTFGARDMLKVQPQEDSTYVISCGGGSALSCASVTVRVRVKQQ
ncbi:MAG: hypothetical protein WBY44_21140 [Bryobacteraceae bacterium]